MLMWQLYYLYYIYDDVYLKSPQYQMLDIKKRLEKIAFFTQCYDSNLYFKAKEIIYNNSTEFR